MKTTNVGFNRRLGATPPCCKKQTDPALVNLALDSSAPCLQNAVAPVAVEAVPDPPPPRRGSLAKFKEFLEKHRVTSLVISTCLFVGLLAFKEDEKATVAVTICDKAHKLYNVLSKIAPIAVDFIRMFGLAGTRIAALFFSSYPHQMSMSATILAKDREVAVRLSFKVVNAGY
ncbi:hypothetical protein E2562_003425 [Oryza meyeriana var. granulata]|uniref:Uncharacterized protein n=1 Tax=Oryza meyeriana var. granulata TaxID=110450 RepID=A0A6G1EFM0_9ORYZ|nr:hypothetical protein E2562_003425 [Oryza meyeriana var. granulata]